MLFKIPAKAEECRDVHKDSYFYKILKCFGTRISKISVMLIPFIDSKMLNN